jgi:hypothetical protein
MSRDKRSANERLGDHEVKIRWAPRLPTHLLRRLYESDATGIRDEQLVDDVGGRLYERCRAFALVRRREVECPTCGALFAVSADGSITPCPGCDWFTDRSAYEQSLRNHYAFPGRAVAAYDDFLERYPSARTYGEKMVAIDRLIHSFHQDLQTGAAVKSVASKLLEGNKKAVVEFLDRLSSPDGAGKRDWRETMRGTIDARRVSPD